jgi:hypothetical protein
MVRFETSTKAPPAGTYLGSALMPIGDEIEGRTPPSPRTVTDNRLVLDREGGRRAGPRAEGLSTERETGRCAELLKARR